MYVVAVIPARGGSSLKLKNIQLVNDQPLIHYTIQHALQSKYIDEVVVSTDNDLIKHEAESAGAFVPFIRPSELAEDDTTTEQVLTHCIQHLDARPDIIVYLSCTQFLRKIQWVEDCVKILLEDKERLIDSAFVAYKTHKNYWLRDNEPMYWEEYSNRQTRNCILEESTGTACASRVEVIESGKRIGNNIRIVEVDDIKLDIHTEADIIMADSILRNNAFKF